MRGKLPLFIYCQIFYSLSFAMPNHALLYKLAL